MAKILDVTDKSDVADKSLIWFKVWPGQIGSSGWTRANWYLPPDLTQPIRTYFLLFISDILYKTQPDSAYNGPIWYAFKYSYILLFHICCKTQIKKPDSSWQGFWLNSYPLKIYDFGTQMYFDVFVYCQIFTHWHWQFFVDCFSSYSGQLAIPRTIVENLLVRPKRLGSKRHKVFLSHAQVIGRT